MFRRPLPCVIAGLLAISATDAAFAGPLPIPDPGFGGPDGIARIAFDVGASRDDRATAMLVADGQLLLAGMAEIATPGQHDLAFARLDTLTGAPDPGFGTGGTGRVLGNLAPIIQVTDVEPMPDGRLLYVARSTNAVNVIGRRHADGSVDTSFNGTGHRFVGAGVFLDGGAEIQLSRIFALPGGKILVTGYATGPAPTGGAQACAGAARLNANGSTDLSFGGGRGSVCVAPVMASNRLAGASDAALLPDGRVLLAGLAMHPGGSGFDMAVTRLLPDGALDTAFGPAQDGWAYVAFDLGGGLYDAARAIDVDTEGRIVIAGEVEKQFDFDMGAARLLPDGDPDPSFAGNGQVHIPFDLGGHNYEGAHSVQALPDGAVLVGGQLQVNSIVGAAVMLTPDGEFDTRFGEAGRFLQADPDAPESTIVDATRVRLDGDYLYMTGHSVSPTPLPGGGRNVDFAATRYVLPLFADGFDDVIPVSGDPGQGGH